MQSPTNCTEHPPMCTHARMHAYTNIQASSHTQTHTQTLGLMRELLTRLPSGTRIAFTHPPSATAPENTLRAWADGACRPSCHGIHLPARIVSLLHEG